MVMGCKQGAIALVQFLCQVRVFKTSARAVIFYGQQAFHPHLI